MKINKRKKRSSKKASGYVLCTERADEWHFRLRIKTSKYGGGKARGRAQVSISDKNGNILANKSVYKSLGGTIGVWRSKKKRIEFTIPKSAFGPEGGLGVVLFTTDVKGQEFYETEAFKKAVLALLEWMIPTDDEPSDESGAISGFGKMRYFTGKQRRIQLAMPSKFSKHGLEVGLL